MFFFCVVTTFSAENFFGWIVTTNTQKCDEHTGKDGGGKKTNVLTPAKKRSRSKEDRIERDEKKRRKLKAESVSLESILTLICEKRLWVTSFR